MGTHGDTGAEEPQSEQSALARLFDGTADPALPEPDSQADAGSLPAPEDRHG